ncbi:hypothetical protein JOM56_008017 [Amanita muscaria]
MPPKLKQMPPTPFRMETRPKNKTWNPGYPDLPQPPNPDKPRKPEKTAEEMAQEDAALAQAAQRAASVQDALAKEDKAREMMRQEERAINKTKAAHGGERPASKLKETHTSNTDFFVSDDEDVQVEQPMLFVPKQPKKRMLSAEKIKFHFGGADNVNSSSGPDGSDFEENGSASESSDNDADEDALVEDLESLQEGTKRKRRKKKNDNVDKKRKRTCKKTGHEEINALRKKSTPALDIHGLDDEWKAFCKQRGLAKRKGIHYNAGTRHINAGNNDEESMVQFGGLVPEGETNEVEEEALKTNPPLGVLPSKANRKTYGMVKVESKGIVQHQTMKAARGGDDKWKLKHLGSKDVEEKFTNIVAPRARRKAGTLEPWTNLSIDDIKAIVDDVFGPDVHEVTADGPWVGLVNARLHNWRNTFGQSGLDTIDAFIQEHKEDLDTKEKLAEQFQGFLNKDILIKDDDIYTYAYQWGDWNLKTKKRHLGRALEYWKDGKRPVTTKPPPFSADNYGDTWIPADNTAQGIRGKAKKKRIRRATILVRTLENFGESKWEEIIREASIFVKDKKNRDRSSSTTAVETLDEDPHADFVMDID